VQRLGKKDEEKLHRSTIPKEGKKKNVTEEKLRNWGGADLGRADLQHPVAILTRSGGAEIKREGRERTVNLLKRGRTAREKVGRPIEKNGHI